VREDWEANFERMLTFAGERGWVDQGGTHVRAHVEWVTT
jgi:hypothetical protein